MNFKNIHIGTLINQAVTESGIAMSRICNFMKCEEEEVKQIYLQENLSTDILLNGANYFSIRPPPVVEFISSM